jgi:hypothetical protein
MYVKLVRLSVFFWHLYSAFLPSYVFSLLRSLETPREHARSRTPKTDAELMLCVHLDPTLPRCCRIFGTHHCHRRSRGILDT